MKNRKEVPVKNHPGIYKKIHLDLVSRKWKETGKYRATRWVNKGGVSIREQAVFDNLEDAKAFRMGLIEKERVGNNCPKYSATGKNAVLTFRALVEKWKPFHFLKLERSTQQTYEKRLPNLDYLNECPVEEINTSVIDDLVAYWVQSHPRTGQRFTFEKELNLLKVILNFYRKRMNPGFPNPVLDEHYQAGDVAKRAQAPVQSLTQEELALFLEDLRKSKSPIFASMALAQFCLGLRIGELCGMCWDSIDLKHRIVRIERTIVWDQKTWAPTVKERPKNGKTRILVLPEILVLEFERLKLVRDSNVPFVFHCHGKPMNRQTVGKAYNRALERLGITHVRGTHMLRKTSATLANEATGDFYAVSKLMDHSSPNVTLRYVAQTNAQKQKVADALNGVLMRHQPLESEGEKTHGFESSDPDRGIAIPQYPPHGSSPSLRLVKR